MRTPETLHSVLNAALAQGYRSIDTAECYRNQEDIGQVLKELLPQHKLQRSDIFITSKLAPKNHGRLQCRECCLEDLASMGLSYLDLFLIHWPGKAKLKPDDPANAALRKDSWLAMEDLYREGHVRAIGVSNYTKRHMEELLTYCSVTPAVLQIEHHPHLVQHELVELCRENGIHFQAYSSLGSGINMQLREDPVICGLAEKYKKSPAQILLRWSVQQQIGILPKSTNPGHIAANMDIFDFSLSPEDVALLSGLHTDTHYCWNPQTIT